nr:MAG TPA: hypothetical protein [Caudoviricetes sp.]
MHRIPLLIFPVPSCFLLLIEIVQVYHNISLLLYTFLILCKPIIFYVSINLRYSSNLDKKK